MGGQTSLTQEDERVEGDGCRVMGAELRGLGKLECVGNDLLLSMFVCAVCAVHGSLTQYWGSRVGFILRQCLES
jgi:hypothetical protein